MSGIQLREVFGFGYTVGIQREKDASMSEWELCDLFGVTAPTFRAGLKALCKSGVLREYGIRRSIRVSDNCCMEVYNLEAIVALAFHIGTFGAERVRNAVLERLYLRKEKTSIFFSLNTNGISKSEYFSPIRSWRLR